MSTNSKSSYTDIHHFFGLTYSSYLVLTRSVLEAMPKDWQDKFLLLLEELEDRTPDDVPSEFWVRAKKNNKFIKDPYSQYRHLIVKLKGGVNEQT